MKILAIETSCDETAVAILECLGGLKNPCFKILSNIVLSQIKIHKEFGGVVPNLARREHQKNLVPILTQCLNKGGILKSKIKNKKSKIQFKNQNLLNKKIQKILERELELSENLLNFFDKYEKPNIDLIAATYGPGLEPALWVGVNFVRALSNAWQIPLIGINHLEGHIFSVFLKKNRGISKSEFLISKQIQNQKIQISKKIKFPTLALIVSGGHTEIVLTEDWLEYKITGGTLDDAAGEAFDKAARILGLDYPGGPAISEEAKQWKSQKNRKTITATHKLKLPRPMINSNDFNFSFSGLKTAVLYLVNGLKKSGKWSEELIPQIAYEFQEAVADVLVSKSIKATEKYSVKTFIFCGGVSANYELRERLEKEIKERFKGKVNFLMPELEFSGDNAAMIAAAAYSNYLKQKDRMKPPKIAPFLKANGNLNFYSI